MLLARRSTHRPTRRNNPESTRVRTPRGIWRRVHPRDGDFADGHASLAPYQRRTSHVGDDALNRLALHSLDEAIVRVEYIVTRIANVIDLSVSEAVVRSEVNARRGIVEVGPLKEVKPDGEPKK